jgi:hypothetical protein
MKTSGGMGSGGCEYKFELICRFEFGPTQNAKNY